MSIEIQEIKDLKLDSHKEEDLDTMKYILQNLKLYFCSLEYEKEQQMTRKERKEKKAKEEYSRLR